MDWSSMPENIKPVRVRFAPSPTGHMHLGSARTALYDYLIARKTGGQFILRIEDSDRKRYVPDAEQELINGLHWLGIDWDEGPDVGGPYAPYRQSERKEIYQQYARILVEMGHAFYCFCTPERLEQVRQAQQQQKISTHYDGTCRDIPLEEADRRIAAGEKYVVRFKTPKTGTTTVHDMVRGDITVDNATVDDHILVRSDGLALYHLAAMADDHDMKITHVIRGSEWLSTFPLHAMIVRAFGWDEPEWIHLSVFLKPSGKGKMSKREAAEMIKDGWSIFIKEMEGLGYLPEAVVNWVALMGWSYDDHTEFFLLPDLIEKFSLDRFNPAPAAINFTKLDYFNGTHIRALTPEDLAKRLLPFFQAAGLPADVATLVKIAPIIRERLVTLDDAIPLASFFFQQDVHPDPAELVAKGLSAEQSADVAKKCFAVLDLLPELKQAEVEPPLRTLVEELGFSLGQVLGIIRVAVTGQKVSPPLFESMEIIGREKVLARIHAAITQLETLAAA
jgi:glutamyl-tRNA synthetase